MLSQPRLARAIGVLYKPDNERASHYYEAVLAEQFDAVVHVDTTRAVEPLEKQAAWREEESVTTEETWPTGL